MTIDQKVRFGMAAATAATMLIAGVGLHPGILDPIGGVGP